MQIDVFLKELLFPRFLEFVEAIWQYPDIFWTVLPLVIAAIGMQIYFGRNRDEELGWNTAFGNSIAFTFVAASLIRFLVTEFNIVDFKGGLALEKLLITGIFLVWGLYMIFGNYIHSIPKTISFFMNSALFINGVAIIAIVVVESNLPLDRLTFYTAISFLILFILLELLIRSLIRPSPEALKVLEDEKKKQEELRAIQKSNRKRLRTLRWNRFKERIKNLIEKLKK